MGRRVMVTSNCQLGGLHAALSAMLPDDTVAAAPGLGPDPEAAEAALADADVWVTSALTPEVEALRPRLDPAVQIIRVPLLLFTGFHPDIVHLVDRSGEGDGTEIDSGVGAYSSAIVAWGWQHGLSHAEIVARFTPEVHEALGYHDAWPGAVRLARVVFEQFDADFDRWYLAMATRGPFMLTDNHPRLDAIIELARPVARRLGADPALVAYPWEQMIPDGLLATATVWPLYPSIAARLDLPGAYVWRCPHGELIGLESFVQRSLDHYAAHDPATTTVARFERDDRWSRVLSRPPTR